MKRARSRAIIAVSVGVLTAVAVLAVARGCGTGGANSEPVGGPQPQGRPDQGLGSAPPVTDPHLRLAVLGVVQEHDGWLRVEVRVERAGGLGPLRVTGFLLSPTLGKIRFSLGSGTPVFWERSGGPRLSQPVAQEADFLLVPDPGGLTVSLYPRGEATLRSRKLGKKKSSRIPSGSVLSYTFDRMVWCSSPDFTKRFQVRMVGSGTVVFEREGPFGLW